MTKHLSESELTYIRSANLELGMYVAELDRPWLDSPFKLQGFNLKTERELGVLKNICYYVYIDRARESKLSLAAKNQGSQQSINFWKCTQKERLLRKRNS